jgi:serine/threonine protein kinase/tetratricopeptide (TPR) repeat protein
MRSSDALPEKIGRYQIDSLLGAGAQGQVFKAYDPVFECHVAIKGINARLFADSNLARETRERILREAIAARKVKSENVATIYDVLDLEGDIFLVMEFVEGETLRDVLEADRKSVAAGGPGASLEQKLKVMLQICDGLARAHELGVIHRDVKPDNVRLNAAGAAKILDFGLARVGDSSLTMNRAMGTPAYMSPEQWGAGGVPNHQADIWACGVMLYEMLAYRRPFEGDPSLSGWDRAMSIMQQALHEEPVPIENLNRRVPEELSHIVERALQKNPAKRYPSMGELVRDLRSADQRLKEKRGLLEEQVRKESAELEQAVNERRSVLDERLARKLLDPADPVDKKLWVIFTRENVTDSTVVTTPKTYSGLAFELELIARQRERLEQIARAAEDVHSFRGQIAQLRRQDRDREDPVDDSRLREAIAVADGVLRVFPSLLEARETREELARDVEARRTERAAVERVGKLLEEGLLEQALKVVEDAGPAAAGSPRHQLRSRILESLDRRRSLMTQLKEGAQLEKENRFEEALRLARSIVESCERHPWLGGVRAAAKALAKRAEVQIERIRVASQEKRIRELFLDAQKLSEAGNYEASLAKLVEILGLDPRFQPALEHKGAVEARVRLNRALRQAEAAEREGDLSRAVDCARTGLTGQERVAADATRPLESLLARVEARIQKAAGLVREAASARAADRNEEALKLLGRAIEIHPLDSRALELRKEIEDHVLRMERRKRLRRPIEALWERRVAVLGVVSVLALLSVVYAIRPQPKGRIWVGVSPWAEILWVRNAESQEPVELQAKYAPCWLELPSGKYEIGLANQFAPETPFTLSLTVPVNESATIHETLPGFDDETQAIDF